MKYFYRLGLLPVTLILLGCSNDSDKASPPIQYPQTQQNFFALNKGCIEKYKAGQNEIQKSLASNECNKERIFFASQNPISGWIGTLTDITTSEGAKRVSVDIEAEIGGTKIDFSNSSVWHETYNSRITPDKPIFNSLLGMKAGDKVIFSGNFMRHPESNSKLFEDGLNEFASITSPEFIIIISDIRPFKYVNTTMHSEQKEKSSTSQNAENAVVTEQNKISKEPNKNIISNEQKTILGEWILVNEDCIYPFQDRNGDGLEDVIDNQNMSINYHEISGYEYSCNLNPYIQFETRKKYSGQATCEFEGNQEPSYSIDLELLENGNLLEVSNNKRFVYKRCR